MNDKNDRVHGKIDENNDINKMFDDIKEKNNRKIINEEDAHIFENDEKSQNKGYRKNSEVNNLESANDKDIKSDKDSNKSENLLQNGKELNNDIKNENQKIEGKLKLKNVEGEEEEEEKGKRTNKKYNINLYDKNSFDKKNVFYNNSDGEIQIFNESQNLSDSGELKMINSKKESKENIINDNKKFFEYKLKSGHQTLESEENPNEKKVRGKNDYNKKILDNKKQLIKEASKHQKKKSSLLEKKRLNKILENYS